MTAPSGVEPISVKFALNELAIFEEFAASTARTAKRRKTLIILPVEMRTSIYIGLSFESGFYGDSLQIFDLAKHLAGPDRDGGHRVLSLMHRQPGRFGDEFVDTPKK